MATRSLHFCAHHGCNALVTDTYCDAHVADGINVRNSYGRQSSSERGYDWQWHKAAHAYLRQHPLCERCLESGEVEVATMVHHVIPLSKGGARLDPRNMKALSFDCHEIVEGRKK